MLLLSIPQNAGNDSLAPNVNNVEVKSLDLSLDSNRKDRDVKEIYYGKKFKRTWDKKHIEALPADARVNIFSLSNVRACCTCKTVATHLSENEIAPWERTPLSF